MQTDQNKRTINKVYYKNYLDLLEPEQVSMIHEVSLTILEKVGVSMPHPKALNILAQAGAKVDQDSGRVYFPPALIEEALKKAPPAYTLCARLPENDLMLGGKHGYLTLDGSGLTVKDLKTGQLRRSTLKDLEEATLVADYLKEIAFLWPVVSAQDCPVSRQPLHELAAQFSMSGKHVQAMTAVDGPAARGSVEIAALVAGGKEILRKRPIISNFQCSISPLAYDPQGLEAAMVFAEAGIPTGFLTMQICCSTAPATIAGSMAQANAEVLAGITFLQLFCPGAPTFYGSCATVMELGSGAVTAGGPEDFQMQAFCAQMARYYNLPSNVGTFATGAKASNWHAGVENTLSGVLSMLAGADMMCGAGLTAGAVIFSFEQLLMDCEIYELTRRSIAGLEVTPETLALETISSVGPGGHFMTEPHTLKHMRSLWQPSVMNRAPYGKWQAEGCLEAEERANERARFILDNHRPVPLEEGLLREINQVIESY